MTNSITKKKFNLNTIYYIIGIVLIVSVWVILSYRVNDNIVIPKINVVIKTLISLFGYAITYKIIFNTLYHLILVISISFIISIALALLSSNYKAIRFILKPIISIFRSIPVASIIIILLMLLGNKNTPYYITFFVVMPLMYEGLLSSLLNIDKNIKEEIKMISSVNLKVISNVYIPLIYPYAFSTILSSFGLGFKVMVMSEYIANSPNTIGFTMLEEKQMFNMEKVFSWTIILIIIVLLFEVIINKIEKIKVSNY